MLPAPAPGFQGTRTPQRETDMRVTLSTAAILTVTLAVPAQERQTAEASWKEGKVKIDYDAPDWRAEFNEVMAKQATWRLGKNDPTRVTLTCGLKTDSGFHPGRRLRHGDDEERPGGMGPRGVQR